MFSSYLNNHLLMIKYKYNKGPKIINYHIIVSLNKTNLLTEIKYD